MFTGIITDIGRVRSVNKQGDWRFELETGLDMSDVDIGASICCSGVCLTVVAKGDGWFSVDVSAETLSKSMLGDWMVGTEVNLERSLKLGDELGGHMVSGHVDGVGTLVERVAEEGSVRMRISAPADLMRFIASKGSITVNGVSLTVNSVDATSFSVNIIPHTQQVTTLGKTEINAPVNLEIDMLARYVARLIETEK